jgi:hypothetical protein
MSKLSCADVVTVVRGNETVLKIDAGTPNVT